MAEGQALRLDIPPLWRIHPVISVAWIKPYKESLKFPREEVSLPPALVFEGEERFEVERILDMEYRGAKRKRTQWFLVKWTGWPDMYNLWLPKSELQHAKEAVQDFFKQRPRSLEGGHAPFPLMLTPSLPLLLHHLLLCHLFPW